MAVKAPSLLQDTVQVHDENNTKYKDQAYSRQYYRRYEWAVSWFDNRNRNLTFIEYTCASRNWRPWKDASAPVRVRDAASHMVISGSRTILVDTA